MMFEAVLGRYTIMDRITSRPQNGSNHLKLSKSPKQLQLSLD